VFRDVMAWAFKRADATPAFESSTCLVHHGALCTKCADVCPHEAVTITRTVAIDAIDCTGCGLCVAACPTHALAPRTPAPTARDVRCSQVVGDAASVACLARLQASDLVRMGAAHERVTLGRGACETCAIGSAAVPEAVAETVAAARALLGVHDQAPEFVVAQVERLDPSVDPRALSRRDLFRAGWGQMKQAGGVALAPLEKLAPEEPRGAADRPPLPAEHQRRLRALEVADLAAEERVPFPLPALADGCIFCPACTRVCPTDAIRRAFDDAPASAPTGGVGGRPAQGPMRIDLEADRCVGCAACVDVCPVHVITMRPTVPWGEVVGGVRTVASSTPRRTEGDAPVPRDAS
jgi:ferredoxin